jgi:predicted nucleic acid-binding protein
VAEFVIDASVAVAGLSPDERHPGCVKLVDRAATEGAAAPAIWPFEVLNVLRLKQRKGAMSEESHSWTLRAVRAMKTAIDPRDPLEAGSAADELAKQYALSVYDAAYLELARFTFSRKHIQR